MEEYFLIKKKCESEVEGEKEIDGRCLNSWEWPENRAMRG